MQPVIPGTIIIIYGHEFVVSHSWRVFDRVGREGNVRVIGWCTTSDCNRDIRGTGFDGGCYSLTVL